jgi:hypothetical protein
MSLTNKLVSHKERITNMTYTDCDYCKVSFEIDQSTYDYLAKGGRAQMLCDDCYGEEALVYYGDIYA